MHSSFGLTPPFVGPRSAGPIPPAASPTVTSGALPSGAPLPSNPSAPFPPSSNNNNNGNGVCSTRRVRKSWQELSGQEKSTFINALRTMKQMPSIRNRVNRYEDFVAEHGDATRHAHSNVSRFLISFVARKYSNAANDF